MKETDPAKAQRTKLAASAHLDTLKYLLEGMPVKVAFNGSLCIPEDASKEEYMEIGLTLFEANKSGTCVYNFALGDWWVQANTGYGERLALLIEMFGEKQAPKMMKALSNLSTTAKRWPPHLRNLLYSWTWYRQNKPGPNGVESVNDGGSAGAFPGAGEPYVMGEDVGGNIISNAFMVFKPEAAIVSIGSRRILFPNRKTRKAMKSVPEWQTDLDLD